jgi:sulfate permease, SulP family
MPAPASPSPSASIWQRALGDWVAEVNPRSLRADAMAALLAAVLVLPQGIAFAALAGLPPAWGLYSAVVPTIVAALAGSSRHVLTGPTNALSLALAAALAPLVASAGVLSASGQAEYLRLALVLTLMVGGIQIALALLRLGGLAHFIAPSVLLGFGTGAAFLIAWHAAQSLMAWPQFDGRALALGAFTLGLTVLLRWRWKGGPVLLLALLAATGMAAVLTLTLGTSFVRIGALPQAWPPLTAPLVTWADLPRLATIALALTLIALGQTVAIAKTLAARSGQVLNINREVLGQGLANGIGSLFSCFVVCGSFNRSVPHLEAGARTPLAGVMAGLFLLLLLAVAAPLLAWVPMAAIHALLLFVAWGLVDTAQWRELARMDGREAAVAAGTLLATLVLPLQVAVLAGVAASLVLYLHRTAHPALRHMGFEGPPAADSTHPKDSANPVGAFASSARPFVVLPDSVCASAQSPECPQLTLLRMEGPVWFGASAHVADALQALREPTSALPQPAKHLLVMTKSMNFIDPAGAALWEQERVRRLAMGGDLYFHRPRPEALAMWQKSGFVQRLGAEHLFNDKRSAIAHIVPKLDGSVCAKCTRRVFEECARQPGAAQLAVKPV